MGTEVVTYIGRRINARNQISHFYMLNGDQVVTYKKVLIPAAKIGSKIEVTSHPEGGIYISGENGPKIIGYVEDKALVSEWEAKSHSDWVLYHRRKQEKEANRDHSTPVERAVRTLRAATVDMNRTQRAAFMGWLIEELR